MLNKQEETLLKELLTKYKQGFISGLIPGDGIIFSSNNCRNKTISSIGGGSGTETDPIFQSWLNSQNPQSGKFLISGGTTWSGDDFVYYVSDLTYFFNGNKTASATQVTLDDSDVTYNRFDVIVVDEAGVISVIKGTAEANPVIPEIPDTQLIVSTILVEAGTVQPNISQENIYLDDPTGSWTLSTYTTGAPTGTLVFNGTTTPKEGVNHIQANADQRLGARFVRATSFDAFQYTVLQVWVRFTGTNVDSNRSLNVRFENSAGVLVGNTLNLFNYGIQRNILNTWQLAVIPITAFGSLPTTVKGFRAIMIGGTVGVTRQWDMDWIHLSDTSVPNVEVPKINFYKDDVAVASQSGLNIKAGDNIGITAVEDALNNRVDYVITAINSGIENNTTSNINGTYLIDLSVPIGHHILTMTGNTLIDFTNMISATQTLTISLTVFGNYSLSLPSWLKPKSANDSYNGSLRNELVILIKKGGVSPIGYYSLTNEPI